MPRKPPLQGVPRQLLEAAKLNLIPADIARDIDRFDEVLSLPRFTHPEGWDTLDGLSKAVALVTEIVRELKQMKPSHLTGSSKTRRAHLEWRTKLIDGTYALTDEWKAVSIMLRRDQLIENRPGPRVSMRTYVEQDERALHEELAERLAEFPLLDRTQAVLTHAIHFATELQARTRVQRSVSRPSTATLNQPVDPLLYSFAKHFDEIIFVFYLIFVQAADLEAMSDIADDDKRFIAGAQRIFKAQENFLNLGEVDASLLRAATKASEGEVASFLEYLEDRPQGKRLLERWRSWVSTEGLAHSVFTTFLYLSGRLANRSSITDRISVVLDELSTAEQAAMEFARYAVFAMLAGA